MTDCLCSHDSFCATTYGALSNKCNNNNNYTYFCEETKTYAIYVTMQVTPSAVESGSVQLEGDLAVGEPGSAAAQVPDGHGRGDRRESSDMFSAAADCMSD